MSNEEFQRIVLEKLSELEKGQERLEKGQEILEKGQEMLEKGQGILEKGLNGVISQTADLTEFKYDVIKELAEIKSTLSRVEINTADNWSDIAKLKSAK